MKKAIKITLISLLFIILACLLFVGCYFGYLEVSYYRIGDKEMEINNNQTNLLELDKEYSVVTYNIGFGAYDRDFSFFMDEGIMLDGTKTKGKYGKGVSKENTLKNTNGAIDILSKIDADFMMLEEVDVKASRSYDVNQKQMILDKFSSYSYTFANNFHSPFLPYPITDMHGYVEAGLLTLSRFKMDYSYRYSLPITDNMISKLFDLDRCINLVQYPIKDSEKKLTMITVHLSAYDEGGVYRAKQLELLFNLIESEYIAGNYVIVGGDFNHDLPGNSEKLFSGKQQTPEWLQIFPKELPTNFSVQCDELKPTCRCSDLKYNGNEDVLFQAIVDGFIVSDNIVVSSVETITMLNDEDVNYLYSDHNAVVLKFKTS